ncbi:hypothetical protein BH09ACT13_BH09ACT13_05730 [soil metagenome]
MEIFGERRAFECERDLSRERLDALARMLGERLARADDE